MLFGDYMFGGGFLNSRLASRIRVKDGLSYGIGSSFSAKSDDKDGQLQVFAIAAPQNVAKVEADFKEEWDKALDCRTSRGEAMPSLLHLLATPCRAASRAPFPPSRRRPRFSNHESCETVAGWPQ